MQLMIFAYDERISNTEREFIISLIGGLPRGSVFLCSLEQFQKYHLFPNIFIECSLKRNAELHPRIHFDP